MYSVYQLNRALADPVNSWAGLVRNLCSHPSFPMSGTPFGRAIACASEELERVTRRYPKVPFGFESTEIADRLIGVREAVCLETPFCNLIRFERDTLRHDPKVLLIAPLSGQHATLLRDTVARLIPDLHVVAICQPCVPLLAAVSLMAESGDLASPRSMTLMVGPIDTRVNPTRIDSYAAALPLAWFEL